MGGGTTHTGGCLCGAIRFHAAGPAEYPHTCSCEMCRRHSGAPTVSWVVFPKDAVRWTGREPALWRSSDISSRAFCATCGSTIGCIDDGPTVGILVGVMDDPLAPDLKPVEHTFTDKRPEWWDVQVK